METGRLETCLKEAVTLVNRETGMMAPNVLDSYAQALFREVSADKLLDGLSSLKLADGSYARENLETFVARLKSEHGQAELRSYVARNAAYVKRCRQVVAVMARVLYYLDRGIEFRSPGDGIAQILALMFTEARCPDTSTGDLGEADCA